LQEANLIHSQGPLWQRVRQGSHDFRNPERYWHVTSIPPRKCLDPVQNLAKREYRRTAQLINGACLCIAFNRSNNCLCHVSNEDRLKSRFAATNERQHRRYLCHGRKPVEKIILRTEHH